MLQGKLEVHLPCMKKPFPSNICKNGKPARAQTKRGRGTSKHRRNDNEKTVTLRKYKTTRPYGARPKGPVRGNQTGSEGALFHRSDPDSRWLLVGAPTFEPQLCSCDVFRKHQENHQINWYISNHNQKIRRCLVERCCWF